MNDQDLINVIDKACLPLDSKLIECYHQLHAHVFTSIFEIPVTTDEKVSLGLNNDITFVANRTPDKCTIIYLYKSAEVSAIECDSPSIPVSTLRILRECIRQGTNTPDIKSIQDGSIK